VLRLYCLAYLFGKYLSSTIMKREFQLVSEYTPAGDQPQAIGALIDGLNSGEAFQTLLGVTGSGKTFTMANVIERVQRPTILMAPNKTLAAQLYSEMRDFFPHNAVEYFVSYYDYYQPEAYVPSSDTFIEKDAAVNEHIDQMRLSATKAILEREDVIIVSTVSAIYGLGDPQAYHEMILHLSIGDIMDQRAVLQRLAELQYTRNDTELKRATFRVRGDVIDVYPAESERYAIRIELFGEDVEKISRFDPLTGAVEEDLQRITIFPKSHYVTPRVRVLEACEQIKEELRDRLAYLRETEKLVEAQRLEQRTIYDLEMMQELGYCNGIENYSRYLSGAKPGEAPPTLINYLPPNALMILDESHVMVPQLGAMYKGDRSRKQTLVEEQNPDTIDQLVRPTGLIDPEIEVRPVATQVDDVLSEINKRVDKDERVLITTLTKRMSEDLTDYLSEAGVRVRYLHSDIDTVERVEIIRDLRAGEFDVLVGINLLREGLDMPEVSLVAILDADKEGFLRSKRSLIQTIGRAARNLNGKAILYGDKITKSMKYAIDETERRRLKQSEHNKKHGIIPKSVNKAVRDIIDGATSEAAQVLAKIKQPRDDLPKVNDPKEFAKVMKDLEKEMFQHAENLEFEQAARTRDRIEELRAEYLKK